MSVASPPIARSEDAGASALSFAPGRRVRSALPGLVLLLVLLLAWILAKDVGHVAEDKMPAPLEVVRAAWTNRAHMISAGLSTLEGALGGLILGSVLAVFAAIFIATSAFAARVLVPIAVVVRTLPIIAITPLITLVLGYGKLTIIVVAALIIFFPTMVNAVLGLRSVPPAAIELLATANATRWQVLREVQLPTALSFVFSGLQIGGALCILGAMVAEWVATGTGLGTLILQASTSFEVPLMWAGVIYASILAMIVFFVIGFVARRVVYVDAA
jgi:NitT/TauT family transport system permease protein